MKISEHANYLLNEYGRLQFDYAAYYKPYGESLRNEARNNLEEYIAELEAERRWIPVSERLPDTGNTLKYYDVILEGEDSVAVALWDGWYKNWSLYEVGDGYVSTTLVTHWRERPTPPEVK